MLLHHEEAAALRSLQLREFGFHVETRLSRDEHERYATAIREVLALLDV